MKIGFTPYAGVNQRVGKTSFGASDTKKLI